MKLRLKLRHRSQLASLIAGLAGIAVTLNQALPALLAIPGLHLPAPLVTAVQVAGVVVPMFSHSLIQNAPDKETPDDAGS